MEVVELYSKSHGKYHGNCNYKKFCTTCGNKYKYHNLCASQDLHLRVNHAPRTPRRPKTITLFKNGKLRKYAYFKGFSTLIKKYILSNENSNSSLPNFRKRKIKYDLSSKSKSSEEITSKKLHPFRVNLIVNTVTGTERFYYSANTFSKPCWKIYRCQFNTQEETCCCSCNSDAMFEVMKSLYDCYKKKNCDHCNCILCGHLPREERRLAEIRKSVPEIKAISEVKPKKIKKLKGKKIKDVTSLLKDKSPEEKEKILRDLVSAGAVLPEGKTKSEKELIQKVEAERIIPEEKKISEKILEERIKSEALIEKKKIPSAKLRKAKEEGLLTPLEGKTPKQKEKILKGLAMNGIPLPTATTPSEKKIIDKVRKEVGLPPEPLTADDKQKYKNAMETGLITPLEGKSPSEKERILQGLAATGVPLPEARTSSEKALIAKIKEKIPAEIAVKPEKRKPISRTLMEAEKLRKAKEEGLLTPLEGKSPKQKEKILKGLAMNGIPLPTATTPSEKKIIDKVRKEVGLPPEPLTADDKQKYKNAMETGLITPLEGKSPSEKERILQGLAATGVPLPEARTSSEKALIAKIKEKIPAEIAIKPEKRKPISRALMEAKSLSEKLRKAKAEGLLTPLEGKTDEQKRKILKELVKNHIPLPEGKTASEKKIIDQVHEEMGLPPQPKTPSTKQKYQEAIKAGLVTPLEGKTASEKEKILTDLAALGVELPVGRTPSEKALIAKVKENVPILEEIPARPERKLTKPGVLPSLRGKTPEEKEQLLKHFAINNIPLPEGKSPSEKVLIDKVRADIGLPPEPKSKSDKEKYKQAQAAGLIVPLEGKTQSEKEKILQGQVDIGLELPQGRTASEKSLINKIKKGKKKKVKTRDKSIGPPALPPEKRKKLDTKTLKVMTEGKGPSDECICGLLTPESERFAPEGLPSIKIPSEKLKTAKAAGLLTPLEGKTPSQKEKILKNLAKTGIPLPEPKTASEKKILQKVQNELGLPPAPLTPSLKEKYAKAQVAGIITPLDGKTPSQKEKILKKQAEMGLNLPVGRTPSEKALIDKIRTGVRPAEIPSEKIRKYSLEGKTPEEKEKILKNLAKAGVPLPEGKTPSEKAIVKKVKEAAGLPIVSPPASEKLRKAKAAGLLTPLEGKTPAQKEDLIKRRLAAGIPLPEPKTASEKKIIKDVLAKSSKLLHGKTLSQKEKILKNIAKQGLPLPEPKTASDKAIIDKIRAEATPSLKLKQAQAAGLMTPLQGKTSDEKEKILKGLAKAGIPLPEPTSPSEKKIFEKVRHDLGLPPEPKSLSIKEKMHKAQAAGIITPLEGKTPAQKEKVLKKMHEAGIPLPKGKTKSEKSMIKKIKGEVVSEKLKEPKVKGLITPLEGKTPEQKEKILRKLAKSDMPLPEGKTPSEKALIAKIKTEERLAPKLPPPELPEKIKKLDKKTAKIMKEGKGPSDECICGLLTPKPVGEVLPVQKIPSEKVRKAKAAGLLTPLEGKSPEQKEKILRGLAMHEIPLPEPKTASEKRLHDKVRADLGMTPQPKTPSAKIKYNDAVAAGLIAPLEGKSPSQKEKILKGQAALGIPLPEGRTPSEKALIAKVKAAVPKPVGEVVPLKKVPSEKVRKAKAAGLLTPLEGKSPEQKEKILKGLAMHEIPLPEPKTASEKRLHDKVRADLGMIPQPKTPSAKIKYDDAVAAGLIAPLEGKSPSQKEKILKGQAALGIPLPEGRTPSEKALIAKVKAAVPKPVGEVLPLKKIPSEKVRKAKAAGLLTPLEGKSPEQKEKILKGLAMHEIPLPEPKTASEKRLHDKVRADLGMTPQPKTPSAKIKYNDAVAAGLIAPLEGKSPSQKEKILKGQAALGIPLPEGRTPSEKALIAKVKAAVPKPVGEVLPLKKVPSEKVRKAKAAGLLTPLEGKSPEQKEKILRGLAMHEIPLPEPKTASEKRLHDKVRADLGMTPQPKTPSAKIKYNDAVAAGLIAPLEGKSPSQKEKILKGQAALGIPLPEGRTPSEKALIAKVKAAVPKPVGEVLPLKIVPSEKVRKAKAAGLLTPLEGKSPEQKEKILKGLAMHEIPLPEPKTASEKRLHDKVRADLGMIPQPKTPSAKIKYDDAVAAGLIAPLEGKSPSQKEKILKGQAALGIPLPEGRTPSEKALIAKVKAAVPKPVGEVLPLKKIPSEKVRKAKAAGLLTPLEGKSPEQKEKILKGLAMHEIPLPEPKTASEKRLHDKVRADLGMTPEPKTPSAKIKYNDAVAAGLIAPLEGKSPSQKEKILKGQAALGIPLPEGRTPSEKALIAKVKAAVPKPVGEVLPLKKVPSEKVRKAKAAGLLTPLEGKSPEQKEKILKGLAMHEIPLPEPKTASEKRLHDKVRADLGMIPQPKTPSAKIKYDDAVAAGLIAPLEGKSPSQKEKILKGQAALGIPLPEGRTPSEKALIAKVKAAVPKPVGEVPPLKKVPSEKVRKAKAAGLLTPLEGKSPEQKEKILKGLAMHEIPLPEPKTASEKRLHDKVRADLGMIPQPKTPSAKIKYDDAVAAGLIAPLEGKSPSQKEKILKGQAALGIPLPEGRTPSEKALIAKVKAAVPKPVGEVLPLKKVPSEKVRKAKAAGLLTPLEGKSPEQKEKILRGLAMHEIPLPEPKTASEKRLHDKVRADLGMTPQPKTPSAKIKYNDAVAAGLIAPLEGKSPAQKEKILKGQAALGIPLPEGRTPSEKALIAKVKAAVPKPVGEEKRVPVHIIPSEKLLKAKEAGLLTPLEGKTPEQKEKILKELALHGIPLPEPKTASESKIMDKVVAALGMPPRPKTSSEKLKYKKAAEAGLITPLQGKSKPQKEKILRGQAQLGLALPEGRTTSEKALIAKIKAKPKLIEKISRPALPPQKLAQLDKKTAKVMTESKKPSDECICDLLTPESERGLKEAASIAKIPSKKEAAAILKIPSKKEAAAILKIPSKKLQKAKAAGLLTPLKGKTAKQKEKILKDLAMQGIPLPEATSSSEKKLIAKVRNDIGLPPEPKTSSMKQKYDKAIADDIIVPLEGKTNAEKEKVLRKQAALGLPLPVGRTPSEKALIAKVEKEAVPSEKLRKAKAAGLLTPLKGKTAKQKEKILKDLAMQGIPLPEATSSSEKKLIAKVRNDIGLPPEPKTSSMKQKYDRAIADDIIVPLEGKTNAEKEKVLRKQAALGLPLPVGRTPSEKALIAKVEKEAAPSEKLRKAKAAGLLTPLEGKTRQQKEKILQGLAEAGIPLPEGKTPSEIALIQKIKLKPEVAPKYIATEKEKAIKTKSRKVGVPKSKGGIIEEFQDIVKTTTCDKGCGCDKKKIRFKHSYVKIRVTSPDISSLCPCPEECLPGVKGGVFTDNEGIKVTVGRVTCFPSNHSRKLNRNDHYEENNKYCSSITQSTTFINSTNKKKINSKSESDIYFSRCSFVYSDSDYYFKKNFAFVDSYLSTYSGSTDNSINSLNSINFLKTKSSVSLITLPSSISVWSFSATSHSTSNCSDEESSIMKNYIDNYETIQNILLPRENKDNFSYISLNTNEYGFANHKEVQIYRASDVNNDVFDNKLNSACSGSTHIIYVDEDDNKKEIAKLLKKTISEISNLYNSSSLLIIVSSSSGNSSDYCSSTICLDLSETQCTWNPGASGLHHLRERQKGFKISTRGNVRDLDNIDKQLSQSRAVAGSLLIPKKYDKLSNRNNCKRIVSTDTTEDRPCCCEVNNINSNHRDVRVEQKSDRIVSEFLKPMILKDVVNQGFSHDYYMLDLPDSPKSSYSSPHHSKHCEPTPVRLCKLPPCNGHNVCHDNNQKKKRHYVHPNDISPPTSPYYKSCDCSIDKLKKLIQENAKQFISIACGESNEGLSKGYNKMERRRVQMPYEITSEPNKCSSCISSKSNLQPSVARDNKKYSCPCEEHQKMSHMDIYGRELDSTTANKQNNCQCPDRPQKKKNKNIVCECPEEPELEFDISDWFDEKQLRKIQSDLTQTTSGFKIQIPPKKSDSEISFEEALKYYAENFENIDDEKCGCNKDKAKNKSNAKCDCQCEPQDAEPINEPFKGIKFRIDGKGTASKGLSGILCFE